MMEFLFYVSLVITGSLVSNLFDSMLRYTRTKFSEDEDINALEVVWVLITSIVISFMWFIIGLGFFTIVTAVGR